MTNGTLRVTTPTDTEIVLTRVFDAPRRLVFDALTKPDLLRRWFGARGWNLVECEVDLRVGGSWRFVSHGPDGAEMGHGGVYREIVPPERLVYIESYDDQWVPGESLVTTVLVEDDGRTTMTTTLRFASQEIRDMAINSPMERGLVEAYDRLAEVLATATFDVEVTRVFDAPRERVYKAFVDPDQLAQWYGPPGFPVPRDTVDIDAHVGGRLRFAMVSEAGAAMRVALEARFTVVVENELFELAQAWDGVPGQQGIWSNRLRLELHDQAGKTRLVLREGPHPDGTADLGRQAWESMFSKLDALLTD